jgi:branched-chain amino acid transport system permease protein
LVLGLAEAFGSLWLGPTYRDAVSLGLLVLVLITRPTGILGRTA